MDISKVKRWRPISLVLFGAGVIALIASLPFRGEMVFALIGLLSFGCLGFFVFTEGFLFSPPERTKFGIWNARLFLFFIAIAAVNLLVHLVTR
jgi:hypothetical protein